MFLKPSASVLHLQQISPGWVHLHELFHRLSEWVRSYRERALGLSFPSPLLTVLESTGRAGQNLVPLPQALGNLRGDRDWPRRSWRTRVNTHRKPSVAWLGDVPSFVSLKPRESREPHVVWNSSWRTCPGSHLLSITSFLSLPVTGPLRGTETEHSGERHGQEWYLPGKRPFLCSKT